MLRYLTSGESHGPQLTAILSGVPPGLALEAGAIDRDLKRRQGGYGRGGRMKIEADQVRFVSGVRHGATLGSPITLIVENRDWKNWTAIMDPAPNAEGRKKQVTRPRPGHADLPGIQKFGHEDARNVLERASARAFPCFADSSSMAIPSIKPIKFPTVRGLSIKKDASNSPLRRLSVSWTISPSDHDG